MAKTKLTPMEIENELCQFYGSENHYRHPMSGLSYTDGVQYVAEACEAYWLLDAIGSYQGKCRKDEMLQDMQFWTLRRSGHKDNEFVLICERDKDDEAFRQNISFSDFPLDEIKIWVENNTMYLPLER